jgi:hypothetical protein
MIFLELSQIQNNFKSIFFQYISRDLRFIHPVFDKNNAYVWLKVARYGNEKLAKNGHKSADTILLFCLYCSF